jgi:hypothetical protein
VVNQLSPRDLQRLARLGAQARLEQLDAERRAILRAFPGLVVPVAKAPAAPGAPAAHPATPVRRRRRRKMTASERKATSERMKQLWADRKKAKS